MPSSRVWPWYERFTGLYFSVRMMAIPFKLRSYIVICCLLPLVLWLGYHLSYRYLLQNEIAVIEGQLGLFTSELEAEIEKFSFLPRVLSRNKKLASLLQDDSDNLALIETVNRDLSYINEVSSTEVIYLMRTDGSTIAASNWQAPDSFIGGNFEFRPYFKNAIAGQEGRYFALGTTSHRRGYYFSAPVYGEATQQVLGVIVVKVNIDKLEESWQDYALTFLVTDINEVVFSSNNKAWQFRTLQALSAKALSEIRLSQQYPLRSLTQTPLKISDSHPGLLSIKLGEKSEKYLSAQQFISALNWNVYALKPASRSNRAALGYAALAALVTLLSWGLFHLLSLRRFNLREKLEIKRESERQLKEAHDKLEQRVEQRTLELRKNNQILEREIGERRLAEKELRKTQKELIHAAKLATLGQLASSITHELNQPLASITNYAENAKQFLDQENHGQTDANLDQILKLSERMTNITTQLKSFSHKTDDQIGDTDLNECIRNALALIKPRLNSATISISLNLLPEPRVIANNIRLEQVFINLFSNAIDAMQESVLRSLTLEQSQTSETITTRVIDTGPGIEQAQLPHIFDAFFTTKSIGVGLGLGLSISSEIIQNLGGSLGASNHANGGAQFEIVLKRVSFSEQET